MLDDNLAVSEWHRNHADWSSDTIYNELHACYDAKRTSDHIVSTSCPFER